MKPLKNMHFLTQLNKDNSLKAGDLLIAEPMMNDPNFSRTVVLVCDHKDEGTFGLVVNRPVKVTIENNTDNVNFQDNIHFGGPVEQYSLHYIHRLPMLKDSIHLGNGVYWGGDYEEVKQLDKFGKLNKENIRFFIGYTGWGLEQIEEELKNNSWVIYRGNQLSVFKYDVKSIWESLLKEMGGRYRVFANYPTDPRHN